MHQPVNLLRTPLHTRTSCRAPSLLYTCSAQHHRYGHMGGAPFLGGHGWWQMMRHLWTVTAVTMMAVCVLVCGGQGCTWKNTPLQLLYTHTALSTTSRMTSHVGHRHKRAHSMPLMLHQPATGPANIVPKHTRAMAAAFKQERFVQNDGYFVASPSLPEAIGTGHIAISNTMYQQQQHADHQTEQHTQAAHRHGLVRLPSTSSILWNEEEWTGTGVFSHHLYTIHIHLIVPFQKEKCTSTPPPTHTTGECVLYRDHSVSTGRYSVNTQDEVPKKHSIHMVEYPPAPVHRLSMDLSSSSSSGSVDMPVDTPVHAAKMPQSRAELEAECTRLRLLLHKYHL